MKILVTGAAGFIGSWLADTLAERGYDVIGVDNFVGGDPANSEKAVICGVDILDLDALTCAAEGCDAVCHCAALPYEGLSVFSPAMIVENIVVGSVNVMVAAIRGGVKRVVNCSSMARYGTGGGASLFCEQTECTPQDPYGSAKLEAERQLTMLGRIHGVEVVHAVPHNVFGPRQRIDPYRNVATIFINRLLLGKPPIIYGDGTQTRCLSYVADVLPTLTAMLDAPVGHGEVFNVGPDEGRVTILDLAKTVCRLLEVKFEPIFLPPRPCEVKHAACSSQKIRERFGFEQVVSLEQGLIHLINDVRRRGPREFEYHLSLEIPSDKTPATWKEKML